MRLRKIVLNKRVAGRQDIGHNRQWSAVNGGMRITLLTVAGTSMALLRASCLPILENGLAVSIMLPVSFICCSTTSLMLDDEGGGIGAGRLGGRAPGKSGRRRRRRRGTRRRLTRRARGVGGKTSGGGGQKRRAS